MLSSCSSESTPDSATTTPSQSTNSVAPADAAPTSAAPPSASPMNSKYIGSYSLEDAEFGTSVEVVVDAISRKISTNSLPNTPTGDFPNAGNPNTISAQDLNYTYSTKPVFVGGATTVRTTGVAVNGVKFEPGTAEAVACSSGEAFRVEALQDVYNLGLDFNNAHVQPSGEYHYHGVSELLVDAFNDDDDLVLVGFAADGFLMYYSKSDAYTPGYELAAQPREGTGCTGSGPLKADSIQIAGTMPDGTYTSDWLFSDTTGNLDECNGTIINGEYAYLITNTYPYIGRCLNGEVQADTGPPPG